MYLVSFEGGKLKGFTSILFVQDLKTTVIGNLRNWTCSDKCRYYGLHIALLQNCLLPSLFRPPRKRLNSIHSRLTPALTCGFNQVYSFSQSFDVRRAIYKPVCIKPYSRVGRYRPCLCLKSCPDVILMESPGSGDPGSGSSFIHRPTCCTPWMLTFGCIFRRFKSMD